MFLEFFRYTLIFLHLLLFAIAIVKVIDADLSIFRVAPLQDKFRKLGTEMLLLLIGLWVTGLVVIFIDYGLDYQKIMQNSKLLMKVVCVTVLSLNGVVIHRISFTILNKLKRLDLPSARILAITGSLSTSHWFLAAFVGATKPLATFSFNSLLAVYAGVVLLAIAIGIVMAPLIQIKINQQRANQVLSSLGLRKSMVVSESVKGLALKLGS